LDLACTLQRVFCGIIVAMQKTQLHPYFEFEYAFVFRIQ